MRFGVGLYSFKSFMRAMIFLFIILTIISIPIHLIYLKQGAYRRQAEGDAYDSLYYWPKYSLGNMGFATNQCDFRPFIVETLDLHCPYGHISEIVPNGFGINKNGIDVRDGCISQPLFFNKECSDLVIE